MPSQRQDPDPGTPLDVLDHLFAAGLDVHRALLRLAGTDPVRHLASALDHIDHTITITFRTGLLWAATDHAGSGDSVTDAFAALAQGTATRHGLTGYLSALARRACDLRDVQVAAFTLTETSDRLNVIVPDRVTVWDLCHLRPSPTWDTCMHGRPHHLDDLAADRRWPVFATRASAAGYRAVHTLPLHRREITLGALTLFSTGCHTAPAHDEEAVLRLADLATSGILLHHAETVANGSGRTAGPAAGA